MLPTGFYERRVGAMNRAHEAMIAAKAMGNTAGYHIALAEVAHLARLVADTKARNYEAIPPLKQLDGTLVKIDTQGT